MPTSRSAATDLQTTPISKVRVPIRAKLTLPYLVLSLIIAVVAALLITQLITENIQERFDKQLYETGKISSELVVTFESQLLESVRLLSNVEGVADALKAADANGLRDLTLGMIANNGLDAVEFLDREGRHVLSVHHRAGGNVEDYNFSTGEETFYSQLEIVRKVQSLQSDALGDKFADLVHTDEGNFLYVSGPIFDADHNLAGVILVGKSLPIMLQEMRAATFAQITIYDFEGQVLDSTLPFPQTMDPTIASQVVSFKDVSSTKRNISGQREFNASNIPFSEILGVFEVRTNAELGVLGVALSQNTLVTSSEASRLQIFLLVAAAIFVIILVGIILANQITRPLLRLVNASIRVSEGDLNVKVKPQSHDEISVLTESFNAMVANLSQSQQDLVRSYDETLEGWATALELRDKETVGHSKRVTELTVRLAEELGIHGQALVHIRRGALLHDIGKMGTPDAILRKEGPLTPEEWRIIRQHPGDAVNMLNGIDYLRPALEIPFCHHEQWDGNGYPRRLKGEEIPIAARIFAVADVWDALTNDRPYRKAIRKEDALAYLKSQSGIYFDPRILNVFIRLIHQTGDVK